MAKKNWAEKFIDEVFGSPEPTTPGIFDVDAMRAAVKAGRLGASIRDEEIEVGSHYLEAFDEEIDYEWDDLYDSKLKVDEDIDDYVGEFDDVYEEV